MPAGLNIRSADSTLLSLDAVYTDFLDAEETARVTRDTALALLSPSGSILLGQTAFDNYVTAVRAAFDTLQTELIRDVNKHAVVFETGFQYVSEYIHNSIGPTVQDLIDLLVLHDSGFANHFINSPAREEINAFSDEQALMMVAELENEAGYSGGGGPGQVFECDEVKLSLAGSTAICSKQTDGKETEVFTFGGTGYSDRIRGGERVRVRISGGFGNPTVMVGSVIAPLDDLLNDGVGCRVSDDLFKLEGVTPIGRFTWDPVTETVKYAHGDPLIFNENGLPTMMMIDGKPVFAPYPGYGWELKFSDNGVTTGSTSSQSAEYWTLETIGVYLRFACYGTDCIGLVSGFPYNTLYENHIIWPAGLFSMIAGDIVPGTDDKQAASGIKDQSREQGAGAKVVHKSYQNMNLRAILEDLVKSAGAYTIYCAPTDSGKSVLQIVRTRNTAKIAGSGAINTTRVTGSKQGANRLKLHSGSLERNYRNMYSSTYIIGDRYAIERRVSYDPNDLTLGLEPAWTDDEEDKWRAYINSNISTQGPQLSFFNANMLFPRVFCAFKITNTFDYLLGGTKTDGVRINRYPQIFSHLMTWIQEYNPAGQPSLKRREYLPIRFEIASADDDTVWIALSENDGLQLDIQGNIYLPGLREAAYFNSDAGTFKGGQPTTGSDPTENIERRGIRCTVGILSDFCLNAGVAMGVEEVTNGQQAVISDVNAEGGLMAPYFRRQYTADVNDSYRYWDRGDDSWPIPETISTTATTPAEATQQMNAILGPTGRQAGTLINETSAIQTHAIRRAIDVCRPERSCRLGYEGFIVWQPGTHLMYLNTVGRARKARIDCIVHTVSLGLGRNYTTIDGI